MQNRLDSRVAIVTGASDQGATTEYAVVSYYATKGGVEGLTKALAVELGPHNVRVNAIAPGFFPSPMSTDVFAESELGKRLRREVLLPRTALPSLPRSADLRGAVRLLASNESAFVTGHTLVVDGGWAAF
jgi:NAD(P)-dependent dehydrogenase (short-subunit alcohol dehydrogenase family)